MKRIIDSVESLNDMPMRYPLYDKEPWHSKGLRKMVVDNYPVFYFPDKDAKEVVVYHVFYGRRNLEEIL